MDRLDARDQVIFFRLPVTSKWHKNLEKIERIMAWPPASCRSIVAQSSMCYCQRNSVWPFKNIVETPVCVMYTSFL